MDNGDKQQLFMPEDVSLFDGEYSGLRPFDQTDLACIYHAQDQAGHDVFITEFAPKDHFGRQGSTMLPRLDLIDSFSELRSEFIKVAASFARLNHPNLEPISQYFEENGTVYAVSDAVRYVTISSELENEDFFYQPTEIEAASKDLIDLGAYLAAFGQPNLCLATNVLSFDDESTTPYLQLRKFLDGRGQLSQRPVYRLSSTIHQMVTRRLQPSHAQRQTAVSQGDPDPLLPLVGRFSEYDEGFLETVDQNLALESSARLPSFEAWKTLITKKTKKGSAPRTQSAKRSGRGRVPLVLGVLACLGGGAYVFLPNVLANLGGEKGIAEKAVENSDVTAVAALETEDLENTLVVEAAPSETETSVILDTSSDATNAEGAEEEVQVDVAEQVVVEDPVEEAQTAAPTTSSSTGIEDLFKALNEESSGASSDVAATVEEPAAVSRPTIISVGLPVPFEIVTGTKGEPVIKIQLPDDDDGFLAQHQWYRTGLEIVRINGSPISDQEALEVLLTDYVSGLDAAARDVAVTVYDPIFDAETQEKLKLLTTKE